VSTEQIYAEGLSQGRAEGVERPNLEDVEGIYRRYSKRVYSLCLRMTGNEAEAQDLTQEVFLHLFRKLDTFRGESTFYAWFYRLAVNVVLTQLRRKRRLTETSLEGFMNPDSHASVPPREIPVPSNKPLGTIDKVSLQHALERLPMGFKIVFVLHDIEGCEHGEIAEMLGCSVGTSKSQLHRARLQLRKLLAESSDGRATAKQQLGSRHPSCEALAAHLAVR